MIVASALNDKTKEAEKLKIKLESAELPETDEEANKMIDRYIYFYKRVQPKTGVAQLTLRHSA